MLNYLKQKLLRLMIKGKKVKLHRSVKINKKTFFEGYNVVNKKSEIINCRIGFGTYIASNSLIGRTKIGKYCSIGDNVRTCIGLHPTKEILSIHPSLFSVHSAAGFTFVDEQLFEEHKFIDNDRKYVVEIGNDVWVGNNVSVMDGVRIGDGAIVGLGAVVTKDIEPYSINVGIPSKRIGFRFEKQVIKKLLEIKWWEKDINWIRKNATYFKSVKLLFEKDSPWKQL